MVELDTAEGLRQAGIQLFGSSRGWQKQFADALGVDQASVSRWLAGNVPIPGPVKVAVHCWQRECSEAIARGLVCAPNWPPRIGRADQ